MIKLLLPLLLVILISCGESKYEPIVLPAEPTHQETKQTLEEIEQANPLQYLKVAGTFRQNFIGEWVVEGTIRSFASVAIYKDVVIDIVYFTKTGTELGRVQRTIFEFIKQNGSFDFKYKTKGFSGTSTIKLEITSAKSVM